MLASDCDGAGGSGCRKGHPSLMDRPLATRMRPRTFQEFVGHHHLLGEGKPLTKLIDGGHLPSTILWGPPGPARRPSRTCWRSRSAPTSNSSPRSAPACRTPAG